MIINGSSASVFQQCRQKAWNWRELRLQSKREAEPLTIGSAFHAGQAALYKGASLSEASQLVSDTYYEEMGPQMILPEEQKLVSQNIRFAQNSIAEHAKHWKGDPMEVLMPEVKFRIALPSTEHHCFFMHRRLYAHEPESYSRIEGCEDKRCYIPHYYTGTTDAVVSWKGMVWLLEHKTSAIFSDLFLDRFRLDTQPRQYLLGIWKSTGVRPRGFLLNVIRKPRKDSSDPTMPTGFIREPYLVSDRELVEAEDGLRRLATNYELAFRTKDIYKNTDSCTSYNRRCYYFNSCLSGGVDPDEYVVRKSDYVEDQYNDLLAETT